MTPEIALSVNELLERAKLVVPPNPALDGWRDRLRSLQGILPMLTIEEASAWAGIDSRELLLHVPHCRIGPRTWRIHPDDIRAYVTGERNRGRAYGPALRSVGEKAVYEARTWARRAQRVSSVVGRVYFIEAVGTPFVKIGFTQGAEVSWRLKSLQCGCPYELRVVTSFQAPQHVEPYLHMKFAAYRARSVGEWFERKEKLAAFLEKLLKNQRGEL